MKKKNKDYIQFRRDIVYSAKEVGVSNTARTFGVNRKTVYRWLKRFDAEGEAGLRNSNRPNSNHPNKMPLTVEHEIIDYKKTHPNISAQQIIRELKLDYSLTTVLKVLRRAKLATQTEISTLDYNKQNSYKPFQILLFSVNKVEVDGYRNSSLHCLTAQDFKTRAIIHSYTKEVNLIVFQKFLSYTFNQLIMNNLQHKNCTVIPLTRRLQSYFLNGKLDFSKEITELDLNVKYLDHSQISYENKATYKIIKSFLVDIRAKHLDTIINKSARFFMLYNHSLCKRSVILDKRVLNIFPINLDHYSYKENSDKKKHCYGNNDIKLLKFIRVLSLNTQYLLDSHSFSNADRYADLVLDLLSNCLEQDANLVNELKATILSIKADISLNLTSSDEVEEFYKQALEVAKKSNNNNVLFSSEYKIAIFYNQLHRYELAAEHYKQAVELATLSNLTENKYNTLRLLALNYLEMGQIDKGFKILRTSWHEVKQLNKMILTEYYLIGLSIFHKTLGNLNMAEKYLKSAEETLVKVPDIHIHSTVYSNFISLYLGYDNDLVNRYCLKLLATIPKLSKIPTIQKAYNILGVASTHLGNYEEALKFFLHDLKIAEQYGLRVSKMTSHINIAAFFYFKGDYHSAYIQLQKGLELAMKLNDVKCILIIVNNLAELFTISNESNKAFKLINKYMPIAQKHNDTESLHNYNHFLFNYYYKRRHTDLALKHAHYTLKYSKIIKDAERTSISYYNIGKLNLELRNMRAAIINLNKAKKIAADSHFLNMLDKIDKCKEEYYKLKHSV